MSAPGGLPPRLLALRLQGFKSFAERTSVEFGAGISAVVGPNGSGKSNLADALRWALGEQGRALRSRKSEDVIWAGSEKRAALGMADVTLVVENGDGLLPVDYQVLELGRRLYRSGENDYLLNKQRIRLRDLVDLLDAAHLADNAFLFIGQGMVDQALALRPEERRPLFEEVAGVRRHERRRRRAQEQLVESEANLARVEDILVELRPQARRLAAQAEQQASRVSTADELIASVLVAAHARWFEAAERSRIAGARRGVAITAADAATAALEQAETAASAMAAALGGRAQVERERREAHDAARSITTGLRLRETRLGSELEALDRDRRRSSDERAAAEAELVVAQRAIAAPVPARDLDLESSLTEAERVLADALAELATLRAAHQAQGEQLAAVRRAEAARLAELETARRRLDEATRRAAEELQRAAATTARHAELDARAQGAGSRRSAAHEAELAAATARETARSAAEMAEGARQVAESAFAAADAGLATLIARRTALDAQLAEEEGRGIARAARKVGGRRVDEDLQADTELRRAVEAALAEVARAYIVRGSSVASMATERGSLVVEERLDVGAKPTVAGAGSDARERRFRDALAAAGGGLLADAIRRDGAGVARRLLLRAAWAPDLATALALQSDLPPGWIVVPQDGSAIVGEVVLTLGTADSVLERRADAARLTAEAGRLETELGKARAAAREAADRAAETRAQLESARAEESSAAAERRAADEAERLVARDLEAVVREAAWHDAQIERTRADVERATAAHDLLANPEPSGTADGPAGAAADAIATWESRAQELRARRDRLAADAAERDGARREAEARRARAEASVASAEGRITQADRDLATLETRAHEHAQQRDALRGELASAEAHEAATQAALAEIHAADTTERERLAGAERELAALRDRSRAADETLRAADRDDLETRLHLDSLRESILVEFAGLGALGFERLAGEAPPPVAESVERAAGEDRSDAATDGVDPALLEAALETVATGWAAAPPTEPVPSPGRLAQLRRRYHELGATNPFAVDEYAELRTRLETLETQGADLRTAIVRTRELIGELETMITDQFHTTFRALESAFERRFEQLFGGGSARLSLTDPSDLGATGVEIVARPPGKKQQALAMLSGGERALTAVALLFAMLEVRPVPFCVLDEVDAALDEANIGRFADALRSLAHQTQFIVITHNRGTIEAADALYGVTVGDDSVSRVISLRLDEAQALADDRRSELVTAG